MQTVEALNRKIATARDLAGVVRTMKILAAVNIRQFESAEESLKAYVQTMHAAAEMAIWNDPSLVGDRADHVPQRTGLIVFGSDQGMCGGFNDAMAQAVDEFVQSGQTNRRSLPKTKSHQPVRPSKEIPLIVLGRRLAGRLEDSGYAVDDSIELPGAASGITLRLQDLLLRVDQWRLVNRLDTIVVFHNRRSHRIPYSPVHRVLLPLSPLQLVPSPAPRWPGRSLPLVTLPTQALWSWIVRQYLFVSLFQACAESQASENAARIAAMQAAETHIQDLQEDLNRDYQQLRQTSITAEILDVVTGFEALTR